MMSVHFGRGLALGLLILPTFVQAAEREVEPSSAKRLIVAGLGGTVSVEVGGVDRIQARLNGSQEALDAVEVADGGDALRIASTGTSVQSTTRVGSVNVVTSGGGSSHVQIGSDGFSSSSGGDLVDLTVRVPEGTALDLPDFTGRGEIGDLNAPLHLNCTACELDVGAVTEAHLQITGSGDVQVASVEDVLEVGVTGDGRVDVRDGRVSTLTVAIQGAGDVAFGGRAEDAAVELIGAGRVRLGEVGHLERSIIGAGSVEVAHGG